MPFRSERQRRFMWSQHPDIAQRWADEGKGNVVKMMEHQVARKHKKKAR